MTTRRTWTWTVPTESSERAPGTGASAQRADVTVLAAMAADGVECSRSQLKRLIEEGRVTADGEALRPGASLRPGATIRAEFPDPKPIGLRPEARDLEVLYEDEHVVVLNKPAGLTVHPSATQTEGTLVHALLHHVKDLSGLGGELRPGIVHRLDKDTSGALVVTKTDAAHRRLAEAFERHEIERAYWALCYGAPAEDRGRIESLIGRNPADRKKMSAKVRSGRRAVTNWRRLENFDGKFDGRSGGKPGGGFASWIEARLETGRTHQVRVHLTSLGHSLLGDPVYGTPTERQAKWLALPPDIREKVQALPGQALHARVLGFTHPISGKPLRFEAPPPPAFSNLLEALQKHR